MINNYLTAIITLTVGAKKLVMLLISWQYTNIFTPKVEFITLEMFYVWTVNSTT